MQTMAHEFKTTYQQYLLPQILLLTFFVYSPLLLCDFINFDDPALITDNPFVKAGLTLDGLRWAFTTGYVANWIPLSWISHMLDVQIFGMNPAGHHVVNILFHVANTALLFVTLKRTTSAVWQSAMVACLFALHPLHVESVAWVAERKDVLSTFFWMLTIYAYSLYSEKPGIGRYCTVAVLFVAGLLAKPMLVTLPIVLLLLDWWPLGRYVAQEKNMAATIRRLVAEKIPFMLLAAGSSYITYKVQEAAGSVSQGYTVVARCARVCVSYVTYLYMMIWPADLAVIYPFSKYPPSHFVVMMSLLALVAMTIAAFRMRVSYPYLIVGWGWYVITLLPVSGLVQIGQHSVADRYSYIPLSGIFVAAVWGAVKLAEKWHINRYVLATFSIAILVLLSVLTVVQLSYWKNSFTLFSHAVEVTRDNWVAYNNLGLTYKESGDLDEAIRQFKLSIEAKPSYALAYLNMGIVYRMQNESGQALDAFKLAVMFEPGNQEAHLGLALVYLDLGKRELALVEYQKLLSVGSPYVSGLLKEIDKSRLAGRNR